jgi:hypothetical protein
VHGFEGYAERQNKPLMFPLKLKHFGFMFKYYVPHKNRLVINTF